jgi:predicted dehydrogenase
MADQQYRAGIIGLGMIGAADPVSAEALGQSVDGLDGTHYGSLSDHDQVQVVAGSTRNQGRRDRFAERSGATVYSDYHEMLAKEQLDIVSVATYGPSHADIAVAAAEAGAKAIWCEKPIATTLADADRIVDACKKNSTLLVVNHQRRFDPNNRQLRDRVVAGELGDLTSCLLQWGGGRLGNVGTHTIDTIRMITGREVVAVSGHLDLAGKPDCRGAEFTDPGGWGMIKMDGGLIVLVDAADYGAVPFQIAINGTKGRAVLDGDGMRIYNGDSEPEFLQPVHNENTFMNLLVKEMVETLDTGKPFPMPGEDAVRTLEAIVAFHASHARSAVWVELPLAGIDRAFEVKSG